MIEARKKQKATNNSNISKSSVISKSSGKTMNNTRGENSRNMVYEYNKSTIVAVEESFHKNFENEQMTQSNPADTLDIISYSEREPSMRASELKSDFRTSRRTFTDQQLKASASSKSMIDQSMQEDTVYSKEESFNKLSPRSKMSTLDHNALKMEFQKNGVINIS